MCRVLAALVEYFFCCVPQANSFLQYQGLRKQVRTFFIAELTNLRVKI